MADTDASMCARHNRRKYGSLDDAIHAALSSSKTFGKPFRYYDCEVTKTFHVTSMTEEEAVKRGVQSRSR